MRVAALAIIGLMGLTTIPAEGGGVPGRIG